MTKRSRRRSPERGGRGEEDQQRAAGYIIIGDILDRNHKFKKVAFADPRRSPTTAIKF